MNRRMKKIAVVALAAMGIAAFADTPSITLRRFQQRYPWNNLIDIDYTVANVDNPEDYYVRFTVMTNGAATGILARSFLNDTTLAMASNGSYRVTWDTKRDQAFIFSKNVSVKADLMFDPGCKGERSPYAIEFLVIDLTKGTSATANDPYPVTYEYFSDKETAKTHYNTDIYKTDKLVLRKVRKCRFTMGSPIGEYGRYSHDNMSMETQHQVELTQDFMLGIFEVTQAQYARVMGTNPSKNKVGDTCPVENLKYSEIRGTSEGCVVPPTFGRVDANSFMGKLSERTGLQFDLPTEAQWECACRAGTTTMTYGGDFTATPNEVVNAIGWYGGNSSTMHKPVGGKQPNAWGFYDMIGNVWEFCRDRTTQTKHTDNYGFAQSETNIPLQIDPVGSVVGGNVILHSGSAWDDATFARAACRIGQAVVSGASQNFGFRISRTLP